MENTNERKMPMSQAVVLLAAVELHAKTGCSIEEALDRAKQMMDEARVRGGGS